MEPVITTFAPPAAVLHGPPGHAIAVLPPEVIDQIAAGEVIERPASVVKELVDNALDAGARTITVEAIGGGRSSIRVCDDGVGMSRSDVLLALERHATSKLRRVDDLWSLATMGFRGEALPSIASVSRMTITTRRHADDAATRVIVEASRIQSVSDAGAPVGTTFEIDQLFANVPVRLKFLKGDATEASHVTDLVAKVAMAHPHVHLRLKHNGRTALEVPADVDLAARVRALLGTRVASRLECASGEEQGVRVYAFLGAPEIAQATARGVQLFVGRRPIRDRGLLHAVTMGYGELIPRGRYPIAIVLIDVPDGKVDVNVHPQKLEVRFADAALVCAAVRHVVQAGVATASWRDEHGVTPLHVSALTSIAPPPLPFDGQTATALSQRYAEQLRTRANQGSLFGAADGPRAWAARVQQDVRRSRASEAEELRRVTVATRREDHAATSARADDAAAAGVGVSDAPLTEAAEGSGPRRGPDPGALESGFFSTLRFLGQLDLTYLVCDGAGELVLVDQHAAHERVELERLRGRSDGREASIQKLLFPTMLEVRPADVEVVARSTDVLARVGFEVEVFGKTTLALKAVPASIRHGDPADLLRALLADWGSQGAPSEAERLERVLAEIACHSVVRAGDRLSTGEAEALLRGLAAIPDADRGPHGRPVLLRLPLTEIARRFGR